MSFIVRDLAIYLGLLYGTLHFEKTTANAHVGFLARYVAFPYLAGIALTGLWVLAHEAGHGGFSTNRKIADAVGSVIHSALMSPYFAWRSSHARHHQYANNVSADLNYVPPSREEYRTLFGRDRHAHDDEIGKSGDGECERDQDRDVQDDILEDAPFVVLLRIVLQQVIGWHWYLLSHITAGPNSGAYKDLPYMTFLLVTSYRRSSLSLMLILRSE
jgi:omega-6 fatty acid desaturase (delta-12 desaturase)